MPLPSSGPLCWSQVVQEFGGPSCLSPSYERGGSYVGNWPANSKIRTVGSSLQLCLDDFYGADKNPPSAYPTSSLTFTYPGSTSGVSIPLNNLGTFSKSLVILRWAHAGDGDNTSYSRSAGDAYLIDPATNATIGYAYRTYAFHGAFSDEGHLTSVFLFNISTRNNVTWVNPPTFQDGRDSQLGFYCKAYIISAPSCSGTAYNNQAIGGFSGQPQATNTTKLVDSGSRDEYGGIIYTPVDNPMSLTMWPYGSSYYCSVGNWSSRPERQTVTTIGATISDQLHWGWGRAAQCNHPQSTPSSSTMQWVGPNGWSSVVRTAITVRRN